MRWWAGTWTSPPQRPSVHTPAVGIAADEPARHDRLMTIFEQSAEQFSSLDPEWGPRPTEVDAPDAPSTPTRVWFLGEGPLPREEPSDPAGLETMRREAAELPLLAELRYALDLIGDGLRVKRGGDPYVSDVREFERRRGARIPRHEAPCSPTFPELIDLLRTLGWVESEERRLRRVQGSAAEAALDPETEGHLDAVRGVIREGVRRAQARPWWLMATTEEHTLRDALLIATTEEGLLLPWAPSATGFHHCRDHSWFLVELLGHPRIQDIPLDLETGHVPPHVLAELAACRERMSGLVEWGLVTRAEWEEQHRTAGYSRFRAPLLMRGALAGWG